MSAVVIQFPNSQSRLILQDDPLNALAERLAKSIAELPADDADISILKLLDSIDRKLERLLSAQGGAV